LELQDVVVLFVYVYHPGLNVLSSDQPGIRCHLYGMLWLGILEPDEPLVLDAFKF
jgi:hypothetical protein